MIRSFALLVCALSTVSSAQKVVAATGTRSDLSTSLAKDSALNELFDTLVPAVPLTSAMVAAYERRYKGEWEQSGGADLEKRHPGILAATMKAGSDTYAAAISARLPNLKTAYVKLASSRLTTSEVGEFANLIGSPAGYRLMASVMAALASGLPADEARTRAIVSLKGEATPAELRGLTAFSEGETVKKLGAIRADFKPLIAAWASSLNAEANRSILKNVEAASTAFIEREAKAPKK